MSDVCINAVQRAAKKGRLESETSKRQNLGLAGGSSDPLLLVEDPSQCSGALLAEVSLPWTP